MPFLVSFGGRESASSQQRTCAVLDWLSRNVLTSTYLVIYLCKREPCLDFPSRCVINVISHGDMVHADLVNFGDISVLEYKSQLFLKNGSV